MARRTPLPRFSDPSSTLVQALALVMAMIVGMLMAPVASQAASSIMTIVDPKSSVPDDGAGVVHHRLMVGDGSGPLTVDGTVSVGGVPDVRETIPAHPWVYFLKDAASGSPQHLFVPPTSTTTLAITSLTFENEDQYVRYPEVYLRDPCSTTSVPSPLVAISLAPDETQHFEFPSPIVVQPNHGGWCVDVLTYGNTASRYIYTTGVGYYLP